ncbi:type II toxin-antitoxin system ParD family antitoxin [Litorimonas haliclonae]|uniref:type II toxin-antitoxin system ParD family antitoxin n=1 Tax=Litorimonas haliclonae TaxID=2081977 RepID=UPI0039EE7273
MTRSSISISPPNEQWVKDQISSQEFNSKSEVINDLIRKARRDQNEIEAIRSALIEGEKSGMSERTPREIMADVLARKAQNG